MFPTPSRAPASLDDAERTGREFMRHAGAGSLAELRSMPAEQILAASPGLGFRPLVDGHFLPRSPAAIFAEGAQNDVPLLAGWNKDEGFNFTLLQGADADRPYPELVGEIFADRSEEALGHYPGGSRKRDRAGARALGGDLTIIHATWALLEAHRKTGRSAIFRFRFERAPLTPEGWFEGRPSKEAGAFHAGEILYVFNNLHAFPWLVTADDHAHRGSRLRLLAEFRQDRRPERAGPSGVAILSTSRRSIHGDRCGAADTQRFRPDPP